MKMQRPRPSRKYSRKHSTAGLEALESRRLLAVGPDGFGYTADATAPLDYDLDASDFDVVTLMQDEDDLALMINLGANTFNFYGENFSQIWVSPNGLIAVTDSGTGVSAHNNTNLASTPLVTPTQRLIAPLWDDWTAETAGGAVLYMLEDRNNNGTPERLIIEWQNVRQRDLGETPMTFQAVLQLNTGTASGEMIFNYPDIDSDPFSAEGAMATVGIKDLGSQSVSNPDAHRLLVSYNQTNPLVGSGKAIRIAKANDTVPPQVTQTTFNTNANPPQLSFTFDEDVSGSLDAADLELLNVTTGQPVTAPAPTFSGNTATFTLAPGSLADGNYRATLKAADVKDAAGNALAADVTYTFHVLAGDANGDRTVGFDDLVTLAQNYGSSGKTFAQGNFDNDAAGNVNFNDLVLLAQRYGTTLSPPAAAVPVTAAAKNTLFSTTAVAARPAAARKVAASRRRA
jgi:hypothetical protein